MKPDGTSSCFSKGQPRYGARRKDWFCDKEVLSIKRNNMVLRLCSQQQSEEDGRTVGKGQENLFCA